MITIDRTKLRQIPLFLTLPEEAFEPLAGMIEIGEHRAGEVLFSEGETGDCLYVIERGEVAIIKAAFTEEELLLTVRGPGQYLGELGLINPDGLRTAAARVESDALLYKLHRRDFDWLVNRFPVLALELLRTVSMRLRASDDSAIRHLNRKNRELALAYAELREAQDRLIEQEALERELAHAREIQHSMLPADLPHPPGVDLCARMIPATMVGGDFYDVFVLDENHLGLAIGDVSGKGIPAALFMALASNLLRVEAARAQSPADALNAVSRHLWARNPSGMFVTLIYGVLEIDSCRLTYARAGHEFPLLWDAAGDPVEIDEGPALPLGMFPTPLLDMREITLGPGFTLLLFSDGVTDAQNDDDDLFGRERLRRTPLVRTHRSASALCEALLDELDRHRDGAAQADDITLLALRIADD